MDTIKVNKKPKALVTGFSSGIGLAYSKYLALNNWQLELVAQNPEKSEMAFNRIKNKDSTYHLANLSKPEGVEEIIKKVDIPVVAIGGIKLKNINKLKSMGVSGFAMISEIFSSIDPENQFPDNLP